MKLTLTIFILVGLMTTAAFFGLIFYSLGSIKPAEVPEEVVLGKKVWEKFACIECHTVLGNGGYFGPDLTDVIARRGEPWLEDFLLNPPVMHPAKRKLHLALSWENTQLVIGYLKFLDQIKNSEWPPEPVVLKSKSSK